MNVLGIISYDSVRVSGLEEYRPIASLSMGGRYRLIDFALSNMTNSGIKRIQVYVKHKARSVIEHLGSGRQYNINSKHGKLRILTGEQTLQSEVYNHDITAFEQNRRFIEGALEDYVVITPSYMIYAVDYRDVFQNHEESGADITILYKAVNNADQSYKDLDTLRLDDKKRVLEIEKNRGKYKNRHLSLSCYMMKKDIFLKLIDEAQKVSSLYTLRDIMQDMTKDLVMVGYPVKGYMGCVNSFDDYYRVNMELTDYEITKSLFKEEWPIYTRTSDSCPAQYTKTASAQGSIVANGAFIEGTVRNSVIGRGVLIEEGAVIEDSVILEGTHVGKGVQIKRVVVDKSARVSKVKTLISDDDKILYVRKQDRV